MFDTIKHTMKPLLQNDVEIGNLGICKIPTPSGILNKGREISCVLNNSGVHMVGGERVDRVGYFSMVTLPSQP